MQYIHTRAYLCIYNRTNVLFDLGNTVRMIDVVIKGNPSITTYTYVCMLTDCLSACVCGLREQTCLIVCVCA